MTKAAPPPRRTEYVPLPEIAPALRNAKAHDIEKVTVSIRRWGFLDPVIEDARTGRLIAGHGRLEALTSMAGGEGEPPDGITVVGGVWHVPVTRGWSSRSDEDAEAAGVALNRMTEVGGWDERILAELLSEFADADPDLLFATGYTPDDLNRLLAEFADRTPDAPDEFPSFDDATITTEHECPRCGYSWSGKSGPTATGTPDDVPADDPADA